MKRRLQILLDDAQRGAVLVIVSAAMVALLGAAAMAVDLGWLYLNGLRTQQAADAASLAGVVHMPDDFPLASDSALGVAASNRYVDTSLGGDATVTPAAIVNNDRQLEVTVTRSVPTIFMKVFGIQTVSITRRAVAEYALPLPLGSPDPQFGNNPECAPNDDDDDDDDDCPNFWANIHGRWTSRVMGDAFSSACLSSNGPGCIQNPDWRPDGYLYGLEVREAAGSVTIELLDPAFVQGGNDNFNAGDNPKLGNVGPTTEFTLFDTDATPLYVADNAVLCQTTYPPEPVGTPFTWRTLCTISNAQPGIYPLRVRITSDNFGLNRFSMRSSASSSTQPRLYGLGDMSIYANVNAGLTNFFLAEVAELHAGKRLVIELFDPGDASGDNLLTIVDPSGESPPCRIQVPADGIDTTQGSCVINATRPAYNYNGDWITVSIDLPDTYTCDDDDCWWHLEYDYQGNANDTTTWTARIVGNPVRLVE